MMTDFADDSSIGMSANFDDDQDMKNIKGNNEYQDNDMNDDNSKTDDEYDGKSDSKMLLTKSNDDEDRKLFLGGLSWDTNEKDLREYFSKYGQVVDVSIKYDAVSGNPRGFGFITFAAEEPIEDILKAGPHTIHSKTIDPKRAKSRPICKKIFVGGVDASLSEDDIKKYFMRYGSVEGIELPFDRQRNRRREFCFIIFDTEDAAEAAVKEPKQTIGSKECDIKKAQPQPVAQQQKRMQQQSSDGYDSSSGSNRRGGRRNQTDNYQSHGQWNYNGAAAQNYYQGYYGNQYPNAYGYPNQGYDYYSQYGYSYGDYWNYYGYGDGTAVAGDYSQTALTDTTGGTYGTTAQNSSQQSSSHSQSHHSSGGSTGGKIARKSGSSSSNYHPYRSSSGH